MTAPPVSRHELYAQHVDIVFWPSAYGGAGGKHLIMQSLIQHVHTALRTARHILRDDTITRQSKCTGRVRWCRRA
jgi:hypothetical protein